MDFKKSGRPLKGERGVPWLERAVSGGVHASPLPGLFSCSVDLEASLKERGILFLGDGTGLRVQPTAKEKAGDPWTGRSEEGKWAELGRLA